MNVNFQILANFEPSCNFAGSVSTFNSTINPKSNFTTYTLVDIKPYRQFSPEFLELLHETTKCSEINYTLLESPHKASRIRNEKVPLPVRLICLSLGKYTQFYFNSYHS